MGAASHMCYSVTEFVYQPDSSDDVREYMRGRPRTQLHEELMRSDAKRKRRVEWGFQEKVDLFWCIDYNKASVRETHKDGPKKWQKHDYAMTSDVCLYLETLAEAA